MSKNETPVEAAPRPPWLARHAFCHQRRALMYLGDNGELQPLTIEQANEAIEKYGSVRRAASALRIAKSTLHDLARDVGKKRSEDRSRR